MDEDQIIQDMEFHQISKEELNNILQAHAIWVKTGMDDDEPGQADLTGVDLRGIRLSKTNLQRAWLPGTSFEGAYLALSKFQGAYCEGAILRKAKLWRSNFQGAILDNAYIQEARLHDANLRNASLIRAKLDGAWLDGANLQQANLTEATLTGANLARAKLNGSILHHTNLSAALHLDVRELAGADLFMTRLPEDVAKFEGLKTVDEAARKGSHLFTTLLLCCLFAWLSVGFGVIAPKDGGYNVQSLTLNESGFLLLAPAFILALFFYFQMCLQRLWEQLALMPAIFPDGSPLDKKAHPWLPIGYVRAHVKVLREAKDKPPFSWLQTRLIEAVVFWAAPASVALFWWRYLERGYLPETVWQAALTWLACLTAEAFIYQARHTLRREEPPPYHDAKKSLRQRVAAFFDHHAWAAARLFIYAELLVGLSIRLWPS